MKKSTAGKKRPPRLDPVFPLPASTGIPPVREGEGRDILLATTPTKVVELSYRAFYLLWEHVEKVGAERYARYKNGGPLEHVADAYLEAVHAFRNSAADRTLPVMSEKSAQRARKVLAEIETAEAAKSKKKPPAEVPGGATEAPESPAKWDRCSSLHRTKKMELVRCSGPDGHKRKKHKSKTKSGETVEWVDDE